MKVLLNSIHEKIKNLPGTERNLKSFPESLFFIFIEFEFCEKHMCLCLRWNHKFKNHHFDWNGIEEICLLKEIPNEMDAECYLVFQRIVC